MICKTLITLAVFIAAAALAGWAEAVIDKRKGL